ncbi:MAG: ABC transporter substrate-binding protein [Aliarcobacter sp.]|nr:ABC transporter substrate-binding protein [Aliarcobacter sp.]
MFIRKLFIICFILLLNLQANEEKQKINLYLDWLNQFQFAGYYIAKEKGYYDNFDLDVNIIENSNKNKHVLTKKVIEDKATYAIGKSSLVLDKFEGNDIILLSAIFQNSPMILVSLSDSNIKTPRDLINKKIMITNNAKQSASIKSILISEGVSFNDIIINDSSSEGLNKLIDKNIDVLACYLSNEPYILKEKNIPFNIISPDKYNFDFYEGILFTSQKELEKNPLRVQKFNQASLRGWKYAFENIEEAALLIYKKYNTQNKTLESLIYEGNVLKKLSKIEENLLGDINPETINEIKRIYSILNLKNSNPFFDANSIIFNKKHTLLDKNELKYLKENHFALLSQSDRIPFSFKNLDELIGIEIDFWNLLSDKVEKPFNIEEVIKDKFLNIFSNSIKARFVYSFEKKSSDDFLLSNAIAQLPIALATKNNVNYISDLSSLSNVKIGVLKNLNIIETLKKDFPHVNFININTINEGIDNLENNKIFGLIDNLFILSQKIEKLRINELKVNTTLKHKLNIFLEVKKEDQDFIDIINNIIDSLSDKEKNSILNNYHLILYQNSIDFFYVLKFVIPLIILLSIFIFFNYRLKNEITRRKEIEIMLSKFANNDSLTYIYNRRKIEELCENELKRSERYGNELSIIFFDVNDFKMINDKLGHHKGDEVLIKIAEVIGQNIRSTDYLGRWGGDEFLIVLPQTNFSETKNIIKTLELVLREINIDLKIDQEISCSFGLAQYQKNDNLDSFIKRADDSMYIEKNKYRNKK